MIDLSLTAQLLSKAPGIGRNLQRPISPFNMKKLRALLAEPGHGCGFGKLSRLQTKLHLCLFLTVFSLTGNRLARSEAPMFLNEQGTKA